MKKIISATLVFFMLVLLCSCGSSKEEVDYGSFTMDKTYSYNEHYYVEVKEFKNKDGDLVASVDVYKAENDKIVPGFIVFSAEEFQGYCWENDSLNFWVQVKDKGVMCYSFTGYQWELDEKAELPDYIKTMPEQ